MAQKNIYVCPFRSHIPQGFPMTTFLKCPAKHDDALYKCPLHIKGAEVRGEPDECAIVNIATSFRIGNRTHWGRGFGYNEKKKEAK